KPARTAAATAARALLRLVDPQRPAAEVGAVEGLDRARSVGARHLHEAKAARPAGLAVGDERDVFHGAVLGKQGTNRVLGRGEGQVANVKSSHRTILTRETQTHTSVAAAGPPATRNTLP